MSEDLPKDNSKQIGKGMFYICWIIAFGLFYMFFNDHLEKQVNPNQQPESSITAQGSEVKLKRNKYGHYVTTGFINGQKVTFMLDTGATNVSVPAHLSKELFLVPGSRYMVSTANGSIEVASTSISELRFGNIVVNDVRAHLNPGIQGDEILLGMSVLKDLEFTQKDKWLILKQ